MERARASVGQKSVSMLLRIAIGILMAVLLAGLALTLTDQWTLVAAYWPGAGNPKQLKETMKLFGTYAELGLFGAAGWWVLTTAIAQMRIKAPRLIGLLRKAMLLLKRNHIWLGAFTLAAAVSHGAYFILLPDKKISYLYTGLGAWFGLFVASGVGIAALIRQKMKSDRCAISRKWHMAAAALFVVLFLIHLYY